MKFSQVFHANRKTPRKYLHQFDNTCMKNLMEKKPHANIADHKGNVSRDSKK